MTVCLGLGDLFSLEGLLKKSVTCLVLNPREYSFVSDKGSLPWKLLLVFFATLASHYVALFFCLLASSSRLKFLKEGGVTGSIGGMFSLSELMQSGSSKNLGLYSCSVRLGHGPESEVMLLSFFQGVNTSGSFWGTCFPSLVGFFHGWNFSVCFSVSSTNV